MATRCGRRHKDGQGVDNTKWTNYSCSSVDVYTSGRYVLFDPGYSPDYVIDHNHGFFVLVSTAGAWTPV